MLHAEHAMHPGGMHSASNLHAQSPDNATGREQPSLHVMPCPSTSVATGTDMLLHAHPCTCISTSAACFSFRTSTKHQNTNIKPRGPTGPTQQDNNNATAHVKTSCVHHPPVQPQAFQNFQVL
jgi:hypothetical protein